MSRFRQHLITIRRCQDVIAPGAARQLVQQLVVLNHLKPNTEAAASSWCQIAHVCFHNVIFVLSYKPLCSFKL